jgi:hypothetical protein
MNIDKMPFSDDEWRAAADEMRAALRQHRRRMEWRRAYPIILGLSMGAYCWIFEVDHQANLFVGLVWCVS